ncbi:hypothetical protein V1514DRAFT_362645 [Lipomyces japonicus]|uniref:uncharacterized protein n=1 Tax=Lipomyces japonicus TaxID=56871 RepID=UPI0034CF452C
MVGFTLNSGLLQLGLSAIALASNVLADDDFQAYRPADSESGVAADAIAAKPVINSGALLRGNLTFEQFAALPFLSRLRVYNWTNEITFISVILGFITIHYVGYYYNKKLATKWGQLNIRTFKDQFYQVGFTNRLAIAATAGEDIANINPENYLHAKGPTDFITYATGRVNVSYLHGKLSLKPRHNVVLILFDYVFSFFFASEPPADKIDYAIVPSSSSSEHDKSSYDSFVFAIVNKNSMKKARENNYDLSLTKTSDHVKLPHSFTVMSESAEITDTLFTPELLAAVKKAENVLDYLIVSDLPTERPASVEEFVSKKKVLLSLRLSQTSEDEEASQQIINATLATIDHVVAKAHWRAEVSRKLKSTRDEEIRKLKRFAEEEKIEEIAKQKASEKKQQKQGISRLSAEEQKKSQQKEKEKEFRRLQKKQTKRG